MSSPAMVVVFGGGVLEVKILVDKKENRKSSGKIAEY